jgi:TonB-linked SusC/RagA family outer membrane protein
MLRIIKFIAVLMFALVIQASASSYADKQTLNIRLNDVNLKEIFQHIEQQSEFSFFYKDEILDQDKKYNVNLNNARIHKVLDEVLTQQGLTYKINGKVIVILQQSADIQQQQIIEGKVVNEKQEPIPGVSIVIKGTNKGTITNQQGHFEIEAEAGQTLVFSFVGKQTKEIVVTQDQTELQVVLKSAAMGLDEVVVTGVMAETQTKKLGFTVEKLDSASLQNVPSTNPAQSLVGKVAGLKISSTSGRPGSDLDIQLRGATAIFGGADPLIIVDGVLTQGNLSDINADDIKNIEVVKGAAASSLYGSRAANGVINITTKRGSGLNPGKTEIKFRTEFGRSYIPYVPEKTDATHFVVRADTVAAGTPAPDGLTDNKFPTTTDPVDQFFNPGQYSTNYVSLSTNSEDGKTNVFSSFQYTKEAGVVKLTDGLGRVNLRVNADHRVNEKLKVQATNLYSKSSIDRRADGVWDMFYYADPNADLTEKNEEDGSKYNVDPNVLNPRQPNPLYQIYNSRNNEDRNRFLGNYQIDYNPFDFFRLSGSYGIDRTTDNSFSMQPKGLLQAGNDELTNGSVYEFSSKSVDQNLQLDAFFNQEFGDLLAKLKLQYLYESNEYENQSGSGTHLAIKGMDVTSLDQASENINIGSYRSSVIAKNYSAVLSLDYKDKYIVDGLIRRDGVSLFGQNERWQTYYRVSGAWRVSEDFEIPGIQELKLRGSHGVAGLRPTFAAQYEKFPLSFGEISSGGATMGNDNLRSSFSRETEIGLDATFLDRFSLTVNYSRTQNTDQILEVPVSAITGFTSQWQNAGKLRSEIWEATLNANVIDSKNFDWNMTLIWDKVDQKVTELNRSGYAIVSGGIFRIEEGMKFGTLYGHKWATNLEQVANQVPEERTLENYFTINNEGYVVRTETIGTAEEEPVKIKDDNGNDLETQIGSVIPDFNMNLSSSMKWKNLSFYFLLGYQKGGQTYNHMRRYMIVNGVGAQLDQTGKPRNEVKPVNYYDEFTDWNNSYWVEDATYLKLRELSLDYTFGKDVLNNFLGIKRIKVGARARNLLTLTNYTGFDPETGHSEEGLSSNTLKFDLSSYPTYTTVSGTLQFTF